MCSTPKTGNVLQSIFCCSCCYQQHKCTPKDFVIFFRSPWCRHSGNSGIIVYFLHHESIDCGIRVWLIVMCMTRMCFRPAYPGLYGTESPLSGVFVNWLQLVRTATRSSATANGLHKQVVQQIEVTVILPPRELLSCDMTCFRVVRDSKI